MSYVLTLFNTQIVIVLIYELLGWGLSVGGEREGLQAIT